MNNCKLCPRACGVNRSLYNGYCGAGENIRVARAALHMWEEPIISGTNGSGTVFFSGCPLKCLYCQNYKISWECFGEDITVNKLADIFLRLNAEGAHNINLVTATPYIKKITQALDIAKVNIPIVYNTGGYETTETIEFLKKYVDIWLVDLKYFSDDLSEKYSKAGDYFKVASSAILKMAEYNNRVQIDGNGIMKKGMIVRHLLLPNAMTDTKMVLDWLDESLNKESFILSLMSQYTPCYSALNIRELSRRITTYEYEKAVNYAFELGFTNAFIQERSSAKEQYTPQFDLDGVL